MVQMLKLMEESKAAWAGQMDVIRRLVMPNSSKSLLVKWSSATPRPVKSRALWTVESNARPANRPWEPKWYIRAV